MSQSTVLKAVLFDLDGTLIDSAPDLGAAADKLRTDRGMPSLDLSLYRPHAGAGARGLLKVAFDMTPDHPEFPAMREAFFVNYESAMTERTLVFDGVRELIEALQSRGLLWGVVTNKMARFTDPLTQALPLFSSASAVVSGDTTPHSSLTPRHCWKLPDVWAWHPSIAGTWGMTSETSRRVVPLAWSPWRQRMGIWVMRRITASGRPITLSNTHWNS